MSGPVAWCRRCRCKRPLVGQLRVGEGAVVARVRGACGACGLSLKAMLPKAVA